MTNLWPEEVRLTLSWVRTLCLYYESASEVTVLLCTEDFGHKRSGPLTSGEVTHPTPPHLSSLIYPGSKRPLTRGVGNSLGSSARAPASVWHARLCDFTPLSFRCFWE